MEINEAINEDNEGFTNALQKPKKPRSEKQKEALRKAQIKRKENIEKRKQEKADSISSNESYEEIKEEKLDCNKVGVPNSLNEAFKKDPRSSKTNTEIKSFFTKIIEWIKGVLGKYTSNELLTLYENIDAGKFKSATLQQNELRVQ